MKELIVKYLDNKIKSVINASKIDEFDTFSDLENFLSILMDVQNGVGPYEADEINRNKKLIIRINNKYKILDDDSLKMFLEFIKELSMRSPSFSSVNYSYVLNCVKKMMDKELFLYDEYERLSKMISKRQKENEDLTLYKLWFEELKNKFQNDVVITDKAFVDFIFMDKYINDDYKLKLISNLNEYNKYAIKNYVPINEEEVRKILMDYGYNINNKSVLLNVSANYTSLTLKKILETIKILNLNFKEDVLSKILSLGTSVSTIKEAYKKIKTDKNYSLVATLKIHNFWIDKAYQPGNSKKTKSSITNVSSPVESSVNDDDEAYELNSSEIFETAEYLKKYPFYNSSFDGMKTILKLPVEKLKKRENMFCLYGIDYDDINGSMALFTPYGITMLDQFIELDLKDYILEHLSTLSKPKSLPVIIHNKKIKNESVTTIRNNNEYLIPEVVDAATKYTSVLSESNLTDLNINQRDNFDEELTLDEPNKIIPSIYKVPMIKYLEDNYKINDLQYKIGNYLFSRKKVLRVASSLVKEELSLDMFLYIMTYQRIISKNEVDDLENTLKNVFELVKTKSI